MSELVIYVEEVEYCVNTEHEVTLASIAVANAGKEYADVYVGVGPDQYKNGRKVIAMKDAPRQDGDYWFYWPGESNVVASELGDGNETTWCVVATGDNESETVARFDDLSEAIDEARRLNSDLL